MRIDADKRAFTSPIIDAALTMTLIPMMTKNSVIRLMQGSSSGVKWCNESTVHTTKQKTILDSLRKCYNRNGTYKSRLTALCFSYVMLLI